METFTLKTFQIDELNGISAKNIEEHLKLYKGYVTSRAGPISQRFALSRHRRTGIWTGRGRGLGEGTTARGSHFPPAGPRYPYLIPTCLVHEQGTEHAVSTRAETVIAGRECLVPRLDVPPPLTRSTRPPPGRIPPPKVKKICPSFPTPQLPSPFRPGEFTLQGTLYTAATVHRNARTEGE